MAKESPIPGFPAPPTRYLHMLAASSDDQSNVYQRVKSLLQSARVVTWSMVLDTVLSDLRLYNPNRNIADLPQPQIQQKPNEPIFTTRMRELTNWLQSLNRPRDQQEASTQAILSLYVLAHHIHGRYVIRSRHICSGRHLLSRNHCLGVMYRDQRMNWPEFVKLTRAHLDVLTELRDELLTPQADGIHYELRSGDGVFYSPMPSHLLQELHQEIENMSQRSQSLLVKAHELLHQVASVMPTVHDLILNHRAHCTSRQIASLGAFISSLFGKNGCCRKSDLERFLTQLNHRLKASPEQAQRAPFTQLPIMSIASSSGMPPVSQHSLLDVLLHPETTSLCTPKSSNLLSSAAISNADENQLSIAATSLFTASPALLINPTSPSDLHYYTFRQSVGQNVVRVISSFACWPIFFSVFFVG